MAKGQSNTKPAKGKPAQAVVTKPAAKPAKGKAAKLASIAAALQMPTGIAAQVAAPAGTVAKLTKRSNVLVGQTLHATGKPVKVRAPQNAAAWQACLAALPCTATVLCQLPQLAVPACVSPQAFVSYMVRRGYLVAK